jgi:hypothetical protein
MPGDERRGRTRHAEQQRIARAQMLQFVSNHHALLRVTPLQEPARDDYLWMRQADHRWARVGCEPYSSAVEIRDWP